MRVERQKIKLLQDGEADETDIMLARAKYRGTSQEYTSFSKAMDLPQQRQRVAIDGLENIGVGKWKIPVEKSSKSGIIDLYRKKGKIISDEKYISDRRFDELTIGARLSGAKIIRNDPWFNARMEKENASAITYGDVLIFGANATVSDVIEETHHYKQNLQGLNSDKPLELRIILNEIDAKKYLINNAQKFKIPRAETELTKKQLESYEKQLKEWNERSK